MNLKEIEEWIEKSERIGIQDWVIRTRWLIAKVKELENRNEKVEHLYAESKDLIKEQNEDKIKFAERVEDLEEENRKLMILVKEIMGDK